MADLVHELVEYAGLYALASLKLGCDLLAEAGVEVRGKVALGQVGLLLF